MLRILINLPIKRLVRTGPDRSLTGPQILEMAKDRRPDCGCGPVRSCDFRSWLVRVRSSPGLFPVLGPDFQTLPETKPGSRAEPNQAVVELYMDNLIDMLHCHTIQHREGMSQLDLAEYVLAS